MKFQLVTTHALQIDGQTFGPGETIATMETEVDVSNVISAAHFGDVKMALIGSLLTGPVPADTKRVRRTDPQPKLEPQPQPKPQPDGQAVDELDPDVLNAEPDPQTEPQPEPQTKEYQVIGTTSLAGLPERIGRALLDAGLRDRQAVADWYQTNQGFADVEGIGKAAERKILAWLEE